MRAPWLCTGAAGAGTPARTEAAMATMTAPNPRPRMDASDDDVLIRRIADARDQGALSELYQLGIPTYIITICKLRSLIHVTVSPIAYSFIR